MSENSLTDLQNSFEISKDKVFISPIPLREIELNVSTEKTKVVAFLGRMHHERGVLEWTSIIRRLGLMRQDFSILHIGDGLLMHDFKDELSYIDSRI